VGLITPHRMYLTIMKPEREAKTRSRAMLCMYVYFIYQACVRLDVSDKMDEDRFELDIDSKVRPLLNRQYQN
jgi:hypothetical protein